ncbi:DUF4238 domain-containing protein [Labrys neptuniae]
MPVFYLKQWAVQNSKLCEYKRICTSNPTLCSVDGADEFRIMPRRTHPEGTGWLLDLYKVEGVPERVAQSFEAAFMRLVDSNANDALKQMLADPQTPLDLRLRVGWTRFLLSLSFRNPEAVGLLRAHMVDMANARPLHPEADPIVRHLWALALMEEIINNVNLVPVIAGMQWRIVNLGPESPPLLTSDRPLLRPYGLNEERAYIALPINSMTLFVAEHGDFYGRSFAGRPDEAANFVNLHTVQQAKSLVWGKGDEQLAFVRENMGRLPDFPIITAEQRREAVNAAQARLPRHYLAAP